MGKGKKKQHAGEASGTGSRSTPAPAPSAPIPKTTTAVASDSTLGYKLRVLLHDFLNVTIDPNAERRINTTTDEHYLSLPYFSPGEAAMIKAAIVDVDLNEHLLSSVIPADIYYDNDEEESGDGSLTSLVEHLKEKTFNEVTQALLQSFIDKRRASRDARPCGPHHLAPMYASLFGVDLKEMQDEKFMGRLRRSGV
jgi:hypothetical protein